MILLFKVPSDVPKRPEQQGNRLTLATYLDGQGMQRRPVAETVGDAKLASSGSDVRSIGQQIAATLRRGLRLGTSQARHAHDPDSV
jgi:hypothetical protein